jgi:anti-sigma factor RsiW
MASPKDKSHLSTAELKQLSALADGSLDPASRHALEARIAASPELRERFERERYTVELLTRARAEDRAPAALRARIDALQLPRRVAVRRRAGFGALTAGALAAVVLVLALAVPSGTPGAPSVSQAAALALRGAAGSPPGADPGAPAVRLDRAVGEVYFPNWARSFGWRATGQRRDRLGDRNVVTVYYTGHGARVAYSIVSSPALRVPSGQISLRSGYYLRTLRIGGRTVVTWRRAGHTCVLSASGVSASVLERLAAWKTPVSGG